MSTLIALLHIGGALLALIAISLCALMLDAWMNEHLRRSALIEASLALGVPASELDRPDIQTQLQTFAANKFSSELFQNRLSDFCGLIQAAWAWLGTLAQICVLLFVGWYAITSDLSISVYAWWVIAVGLFFWVSSMLFALICKLLTGRLPGQARRARKILVDAMA